MKTLKFKPHLVNEILSGRKTSTFSLFDDKDIQVGDVLNFLNKDSGQLFGIATVTLATVKTLATLTPDDYAGHEKYESEEAMYAEYRTYYGDKVGPEIEVKIIHFDFEAKSYPKCVVVDENDSVLGTEYMQIAVEKGLIRRVSRVFVFNQSGKLLIQMRGAKINKPLLLDQSAAGHVDEGETYEITAKKELFEELGLSAFNLIPVAVSFRTREFFNGVYRVVVPDDVVINFDTEEVEAIYWYDIDELDKQIINEPKKFNPDFIETWVALRDKLIA